LMSSPETPKSHILISPLVLARILDGLISFDQLSHLSRGLKLTSVNNTVDVIKVDQAFQHRLGYRADNVDGDETTSTIDLVKGSEWSA
jgi:hypothetical protein